MAKAIRPVFLPTNNLDQWLFTEKNIEFDRYMGFAMVQKRKSIESLQNNAKKLLWIKEILEISSKSEDSLWIDLSAFNLKLTYNWFTWSIESFFQWSKKFTYWWPFTELYTMTWRDAKIFKNEKFDNIWKLEYFDFFWEKRDLKLPETIFYDWLYINALIQNKNLQTILNKYEAFSDIAFNPSKSINCQARSIAIFLSIKNSWYAFGEFLSKEEIINIYSKRYKINTEKINWQVSLF
jgi:hypothetical protein